MSGSRVRLERASVRRQREFLDAVRRSRRFHAPWVAAPSSAPAYRQYLARSRRRTQVAYFVVRRDTNALAGVINVSEIVHGNFQSAYLGYYAFAPHAAQGLMREGLTLVIDAAFTHLKLHRLEANIQPANTTSIHLVKRLGFRLEGLSRRYLHIAGDWRDHERWALLKEDWQQIRRKNP